jgi:hypothetical protein
MLRSFALPLVLLALSQSPRAYAQPPAEAHARKPLNPTPAGGVHRTRLILKDGSFQVVTSYTQNGDVVSYVSAERGDTEELPASLVDWDATHAWERRHAPAPEPSADGSQPAPPPIDPELLKEEADRRALTPEVAPNLELPEQDSVLVLDQYQGTPELVPLVQSDGELNRTTSHNILKLALNPRAASHQIAQLKGESANVQLHVDTPVIYLRLGDGTGIRRGGTPLTVDTHGASAAAGPNPAASPESGYVFVRADVRTDARVLASFSISALGTVQQRQEDVTEATTETLPGGDWLKITPKRPLDFGEYALMEVLSDREINLGVWDFGIHPVAPENRDVLKPQPRRPATLERRDR